MYLAKTQTFCILSLRSAVGTEPSACLSLNRLATDASPASYKDKRLLVKLTLFHLNNFPIGLLYNLSIRLMTYATE